MKRILEDIRWPYTQYVGRATKSLLVFQKLRSEMMQWRKRTGAKDSWWFVQTLLSKSIDGDLQTHVTRKTATLITGTKGGGMKHSIDRSQSWVLGPKGWGGGEVSGNWRESCGVGHLGVHFGEEHTWSKRPRRVEPKEYPNSTPPFPPPSHPCYRSPLARPNRTQRPWKVCR